MNVAREASDHQRVLAESRASEQRSRSILESITDGFFTLDRDWRFDYVNPEAERILGREPGSLLGKVLWQEYPGTVGSAFEETYRRVVAARAAESFLAYYPDHERWYDVRAYPSPDGLSVYFRDVTQARRAESALRASEEQRGLALDSAELGTWSVDPATEELTCDERFRMIFSGSTEPLSYEQAFALIHPEDGVRMRLAVAAALSADDPAAFDEEHRIVRPDEALRWVHGKGRANFDRQGPQRRLVSFDGTVADITERKRNDERVRHGEERLRMALNAARMVAWEYDPASGKVVVSDNAGELFGLLPGGTLENSNQVFALVHPGDVDRHRSTVARAVEERGSYLSQYRLIRPLDQAVIWLEERGQAVLEGASDGVRLAGVVMDITERKEAEKALLTRHQHARLLSDVSARLVLRSKDGKRESADEFLATVFAEVARHLDVEYYFNFALADEPETLRLVSCRGLDAAAQAAFGRIRFGEYLCGLVAQTRAPLVVEDLQHCALDNAGAMCAMGASAYAGYPMLTDGRLIGTISFATARRLRFTAEELALMQAVADLLAAAVERDRLLLSLAQAEERFRTLADNIPQLAWIADAGTDGQVHWFNKSWLEYTGASLEEMRGSGWQSVHHPDHAERVIDKFAHHVKEGLDWEDTFPLRGKDGRFRWFLSRMNVMRDESGAVARIFGTNTDITEQRDMADQLKKQAAELSAADRRKDEFLATLAHELRNPLAPIRNSLHVMRLEANHGDVVEHARLVMERQLAQMVRLVDDLLDVSRISRDKLELRKEPVELAAVVNSAVETSRPLIDESGLLLTVTLPPQPIHLHADFTRLAQVFMNLLNNAAKFTQRGGRISLTAERQDGDVLVAVKDNGVGISAEHLPRIFEMFSQVKSALERSQGGLGIGLTLVRRLVELHGGRVDAQSDGPGRGSEFVVRLPVALSMVREPPTAQELEKPRAPAFRILVVDDNHDAAISAAVMLELMGNQTRSVHDGPAALEAAASWRPDIVLLDIGLPGVNGYDVARRIRAEPWGENMLLLALTGWGRDEDKRKSREAGFDRHLVKPVDPSVLAGLLAEWASR